VAFLTLLEEKYMVKVYEYFKSLKYYDDQKDSILLMLLLGINRKKREGGMIL